MASKTVGFRHGCDSLKLAAIVSVGMSKIGKRPELSGRELVVEAFLEAWKGCRNLERKDIESVYVGSQSESYEHQILYGSLVSDWLGLLPAGSVRIEGCAASGALAIRAGILAIMSGMHEVVLVCGVEKMSLRTPSQVADALMAAGESALEQYNGLSFPGIYAMMATSHMAKYGSNEDDLAAVAVKNHKNALDNPKAQIHKSITKEDVLKSRVVAWPLKLFDSSPISDGAAVAVLTRPDLAAKFSDSPTFVVGMGHKGDTMALYEREDISWPGAMAEACREAYGMARVESKDVSLAEVHDAFTINEILAYEAAGFAERGEGHLLVRGGQTEIGGKVSVSPSGGLKARGHPIGATGVCQVYEVHNQLIGNCGKRQVPGARYGLTMNEGGSNAVVAAHIISN